MAVTYGFFNSINGDRKYNADQMSNYFEGLVSDGVYNSVGNSMVVQASSGMNITVGSGRAVIGSKWVKNDSALTLSVTGSHPTLNRYTAVVIKLDKVNRNITITTVDGTPASTPTYPTITNTDTVMYLVLAYIYVGAAVTSISQSNITDTRTDSTVCGWVTGLIEQVDTSTLFLQWQEGFDTWFNALTAKLNVNTYIQEYYKRVVLSSGSSTVIPLDMTGYTYDSSDILFIYINGLAATPDVDYYLDTSGSTAQLHPSVYKAGTEIEIKVLKSKIGFNALTTSGGNNIVTSNDEMINI